MVTIILSLIVLVCSIVLLRIALRKPKLKPKPRYVASYPGAVFLDLPPNPFDPAALHNHPDAHTIIGQGDSMRIYQ